MHVYINVLGVYADAEIYEGVAVLRENGGVHSFKGLLSSTRLDKSVVYKQEEPKRFAAVVSIGEVSGGLEAEVLVITG